MGTQSAATPAPSILTFTLDTNNASADTELMDIDGNRLIGVFVKNKTGISSTHKVRLQVSPNGIDVYDTTLVVTGTGFAEIESSCQWCCVKTDTAEGAPSTVDVTISAK